MDSGVLRLVLCTQPRSGAGPDCGTGSECGGWLGCGYRLCGGKRVFLWLNGLAGVECGSFYKRERRKQRLLGKSGHGRMEGWSNEAPAVIHGVEARERAEETPIRLDRATEGYNSRTLSLTLYPKKGKCGYETPASQHTHFCHFQLHFSIRGRCD